METRDRDQDSAVATRYVQLSRDEWAHLREATPLTLSEEDVDRLRGLNDPVSVKEVVEIYLPLSRLLNLRVAPRRDCTRRRAVPRDDRIAAAVHHRHRRQRRRRQEHDRAHCSRPCSPAGRITRGSIW